MTLGTDLSDDQTLISPSAYKQSGRSFAIRKLGEGLKGPGDYVGANNALLDISRMHAVGVDMAGYWFVHPNIDGAAQAHMAGGIARAAGIKGLSCDCEVPDTEPWNQISSVMHAFLGAVAAQGFSNLIYDNKSWVDTLNAEQWGVPLWYANPSVLMPDRGCVNWQYGLGTVPGIANTVDLDNWTGGPASYDLFFHGTRPLPQGDDMAVTNDWLIRNCYRVVLHREVDGAGYTTWAEFLSGGGDAGEMWAKVQDSAEGQAVLAAERRSLGL